MYVCAWVSALTLLQKYCITLQLIPCPTRLRSNLCFTFVCFPFSHWKLPFFLVSAYWKFAVNTPQIFAHLVNLHYFSTEHNSQPPTLQLLVPSHSLSFVDLPGRKNVLKWQSCTFFFWGRSNLFQQFRKVIKCGN